MRVSINQNSWGRHSGIVGVVAFMFQSFIITVREGVEAFLIVAISIAFLKKTGRHRLLSAVYWGILVSVLLSLGAGVLLHQGVNQSLWEG